MRFAPIWRHAVRKGRECAALTAEVRGLKLDNAILTARLRLAMEQRDRARDVACAVEGEPFTAADRAMLGWEA